MIDRKEIINITNTYLKFFEEKNVIGLKNLFDSDIVLYDPVIKEVKGINNVIKANQNIFLSCEKITYVKKRIIVDHLFNISVAELEILFDKNKVLVVDIIEFNESGKIEKITAYLDTGK